MLITLIGLVLAFTVVLHIWAGIYLLRLKLTSFFIPLHIYLNILIAVSEFTAIFWLQDNLGLVSEVVFKIGFVAQCFIPPIFFLLSRNYTLGSSLPKMSVKNIIFFGISFVLSICAIFDWVIVGKTVAYGCTFPKYSLLYWLFIGYFYTTLFLTLTEFSQKYKQAKRKPEKSNLKQFVNIILPVLIATFALLHLLPFWGITHPLVLLAFPILTLIIIYMTIKWNLLDFDEYFSYSASFFTIATFFIFFILMNLVKSRLWIFVLSIPAALGIWFISETLQRLFQKRVVEYSDEETYDLEEELEMFGGEIGRFIEIEELARYLADFSRKILRCTKCAVVATQFDVKPYQLIFSEGFIREEMEELIANPSVPIFEMMESDRKILSRQDHSPTTAIGQMMARLKLYLVIPLVTERNLVGFLLLGDDRKSMYLKPKDVRFMRLMSVQAANSFQNIQAIQDSLQAQKMAELGVVASQLAHDFQSFITLVKLDVPGENRLRQHANYMEKVVSDLLNYARPEDLKIAPEKINQLIDMTLDLLNIPESISIEKHYSESIPAINVDSNQMRRVFLNLFENSIRAMDGKRGRIKITTRPLRPLSKVRRNPWIYIEIFDEGKGIPDEFLERIFDPFFTTYKPEGGSGMGLAIVKQIITRHKGFIDVTSKAGKGTIFNIRLPYLIR